jgi:hypothetical protein
VEYVIVSSTVTHQSKDLKMVMEQERNGVDSKLEMVSEFDLLARRVNRRKFRFGILGPCVGKVKTADMMNAST